MHKIIIIINLETQFKDIRNRMLIIIIKICRETQLVLICNHQIKFSIKILIINTKIDLQ